MKYTRVSLELLLEVYKMTNYQKKNLDDWMKEGLVTIPKEYNYDDDNILQQEVIQVEPWRIKSYYKSDKLRCYYHLHPELVDTDNTGNESTFLCPRCYKSYEDDTCYKLSIAAGVDFGNYHRINGLIEPNIHEQIVLLLN